MTLDCLLYRIKLKNSILLSENCLFFLHFGPCHQVICIQSTVETISALSSFLMSMIHFRISERNQAHKLHKLTLKDSFPFRRRMNETHQCRCDVADTAVNRGYSQTCSLAATGLIPIRRLIYRAR